MANFDFDRFLPKPPAPDPVPEIPQTPTRDSTPLDSDDSDYEQLYPLTPGSPLEPELQAIKDHYIGRFRLSKAPDAEEPLEPEPEHELEAPKAKKRPQKRRKAKSPTPDYNDDTSNSGQVKKRKHTSTSRNEDSKVTFYVDIELPSPPVPASKARPPRGKVPPPEIRTKGPFLTAYPPSESWEGFLRLVANTAKCSTSRLVTDKMAWHYATPKSDPKKPLTCEDGYYAMGFSLKDRKKDLVVHIYMPLPPPAPKELSWSDGEKENQFEAQDYDELEVSELVEVDLSAKAQIAAITSSSASIIEKLRQLYPIGGCKEYPHLHVYTHATTSATTRWELTPLRLQIWAAGIVKGETHATLTRPPASKHFSYDQRIKTPPAVIQPDVPNLPAPPPPPMPPMPQWPYPYMYAGMPPYPPANFVQTNLPQLPVAPPQPPTPRLTDDHLATIKYFTMDDFINYYSLSTAEEAAFHAIGYTPGDVGIEDLSLSDWKDVDVPVLVGKRAVKIHHQFLNDVMSGRLR